jgi:hypothetical protein
LLTLALLLGAIPLAGQSAQQQEQAATAKAQAIAVGGGPEALTSEIAAELADLGRYEDRLLTGNFGPALKNFPQEAANAFKRLDFEIQLNLLTSSWDRFAFPAMAPVLKSLYQSPPDDSSRVRDMALRRLYQLDPTAARAYMLDELQRGDLRVSMVTLSLLPDQSFREYEAAWLRALIDGVLDERIDAAVRIERFGSSAALADVKRIYAGQGRGWACDVRIATLAYLAKYDRDAAIERIREASSDPVCKELIQKHPQLRGFQH